MYILFVIFIVVSPFVSKKMKTFMLKIHKSTTDSHSWLRYACSIILVVTLGIAIIQATYSDINTAAIGVLIGVAISGKVAQSGLNKDK